MNLLKNIFKKDKFLYPDLKPGDRIFKIIHEYIFPDLQKIDFKMSKTSLSIRRKVGDFDQEIYFQKDKNNHADKVVAFDPLFSVHSKSYAKWCAEKYGVPPINDCIKGTSAMYIPNWDKKLYDGWYDLARHDNLEIIKVLKNNIDKSGLLFLNTFSDRQSTIDFILNSNSNYYAAPMLFDFAFQLGDKKKAEQILKWFTDYKNNSDKNNWQDYTLREIAHRQTALNNWA